MIDTILVSVISVTPSQRCLLVLNNHSDSHGSETDNSCDQEDARVVKHYGSIYTTAPFSGSQISICSGMVKGSSSGREATSGALSTFTDRTSIWLLSTKIHLNWLNMS